MKKIVICFAILLAVIISGVSYAYVVTKNNYYSAKKENSQYDSYYNQEIQGTEIATLINRIINNNIRNDVQKGNDGVYIANNENSINMDIKFTDDDKTHPIEILYSNGIEKFIQYYGQIKFKCTKVEYHKKTNKVKYLLFEQISE